MIGTVVDRGRNDHFTHLFKKPHMRNFITKILLLIKVSYHIISAINIVIGGFGKHRNTSTSFVAPLLIVPMVRD